MRRVQNLSHIFEPWLKRSSSPAHSQPSQSPLSWSQNEDKRRTRQACSSHHRIVLRSELRQACSSQIQYLYNSTKISSNTETAILLSWAEAHQRLSIRSQGVAKAVSVLVKLNKIIKKLWDGNAVCVGLKFSVCCCSDSNTGWLWAPALALSFEISPSDLWEPCLANDGWVHQMPH